MQVKVANTRPLVTGSSITGELDGVKSVDVNFSNSLDRTEACGQRTDYAITEGNIKISGTIERYWTGSGADTWNMGSGSGGTGSLSTYYIGIYPGGAVTGQPYIMLDQVKFGEQKNTHRPGSALMTSSIDFEAIRTYSGSLP